MPNKTDANQAEIVKTIRALGGEWISTSGDPKIGMDGIVCHRRRIYLVEIKDGRRAPSQRRLTPTEQKRKIGIEAAGCKYWIIESVDDALSMLANNAPEDRPCS